MRTSLNPVELIFGGVSETERINFTRHLGIIIKAGLPVLEGLRIIQKQTKSRTLKKITAQLMIDVNAGRLLADGLEKYKSIFGEFYVNIIRVGETTGSLAENLGYIGEEMGKARTMRKKLRAAMVYPTILFVMTISISSFLTFYIFPKMIVAFTSLNVPLPTVTKVMISTLTFLQAYWWLLLITGIVVFIVARLLMMLDPVKIVVAQVVIYTPVLGGLVKNVNMANAARLLGVLLKSSIRIVEALTIVSLAMDNILYRRALQAAAEEVRRGGSFSDYISKNETLFTTIFASMVAVGEKTGNLEKNLFYLAEYHTEEMDSSLNSLTAMMEPLIILVMGLIVGFVAIAVITPIYSITQGVIK